MWPRLTKHALPVSTSQGLFGKSLDSPAAADADASDTQSVDSGLSRQDGSTGKRDTVCQVSAARHPPCLSVCKWALINTSRLSPRCFCA